MTHFAAWWPITDDTLTTSELIAEATDDLADMVDAAGHVITGPTRWAVETLDDGETSALTAATPVQPVTYARRPKQKVA